MLAQAGRQRRAERLPQITAAITGYSSRIPDPQNSPSKSCPAEADERAVGLHRQVHAGEHGQQREQRQAADPRVEGVAHELARAAAGR